MVALAIEAADNSPRRRKQKHSAQERQHGAPTIPGVSVSPIHPQEITSETDAFLSICVIAIATADGFPSTGVCISQHRTHGDG